MATLYKKRGRWYIDYVLNGKKKTKSTKLPATKIFKLEAEKIKLKIELLIKSDENKFVTKKEGITLELASDKFLNEHLLNKSNSHKDVFVRVYNQFTKIVPSESNIKDIEKDSIKLFIEQFKNNHSIETVRTYLRYLKIFFNYLVEADMIIKSPIPKNLMPKSLRKPISIFNLDTLNKIFETAKERDYKYYLILKTLELTGQRPCDILRLRWNDIDMKRNIIYIKLSKTNKVILFPVYNELRNFIIEEIYNHFNYVNEDEIIFKDYSVEILGKRFRRIKKFLDIQGKGIDLKTFRKTFGSKLASSGMERSRIAELLGHDSVQTTIKYYASIKSDSLRGELNKIWEENDKNR